MSTFQLKLLAITTMIIDHVGYYFFPQIIWLRLIGRLSFPLFAWLIANGAHHTKNITAYFIRIACCALLAQIPYMLLNRTVSPGDWILVNALVTLSVGLAAIIVIQKTKDRLFLPIIVILFAQIANLIGADYSIAGVLSVVAFYLTFGDSKKTIISQVCIYLFFFTLPEIKDYVMGQQINFINFIEPIGLLSLFFITAYNQHKGKSFKYAFYLFYPLHLLLLYIIKLL